MMHTMECSGHDQLAVHTRPQEAVVIDLTDAHDDEAHTPAHTPNDAEAGDDDAADAMAHPTHTTADMLRAYRGQRERVRRTDAAERAVEDMIDRTGEGSLRAALFEPAENNA